jgi:hypothetical protein
VYTDHKVAATPEFMLFVAAAAAEHLFAWHASKAFVGLLAASAVLYLQ